MQHLTRGNENIERKKKVIALDRDGGGRRRADGAC